MSRRSRRVTIPAAAKRVDSTTALSGERIDGNRHRVVDDGGDGGNRQKTGWCANDQVIGRILVAVLTTMAGFAFFPPDARAETATAESTVEQTKAYGEWWDPTGTVFRTVLCSVVAESGHAPGGQKESVAVGRLTYFEHDVITGDTYFASGPVPNPAPIRGGLLSASYRATIPLSQYDPTTGDFVEVGTVTIAVDLKGVGPIVKTNFQATGKDASNFNLRQSFVGSTRNAVPTFVIDEEEVDASLFDSLLGFMTVGRSQYKYTVNP